MVHFKTIEIMKTKIYIITVLKLFVLANIGQAATIIFSDTFNHPSTPSDYGYYSYHPNPVGTGWIITPNNFMRNFESSSSNATIIRSFEPVTIQSVGEWINLTFAYNNGQNVLNDPQNAMSAILYNIGSPVIADNFGGTNPLSTANGLGYWQSHNSSDTFFREIAAGSPANLGTGTTTTNNAIPDGTVVIYDLRLEIVAEGIQLSGSVNDIDMTSYIIEGQHSLTVDAFTLHAPYVFNASQRWRDSKLQSVELSVNIIPEAGYSGAIVGIIVLIVAIRKKRIRA